MALQLLTGTDPSGAAKPMLLNGSAYVFGGPLTANQGASTGWLPIGNYMSLLYIIQSDQIGNISAVEYSTDGVTVNASGTGRAYAIPNRILQVALTLKDKFFRVTYTNGPTAANLYFECKLSTATFQNTMASAYQPTTMTNLASLVKSIVELLDNSTGTYDQVYRTGNSMNVHVDNPGSATDVSLLAKDATLTSLLNKVIAAPSTEAKQDALNTLITAFTNASHTDLAAILTKLNGSLAVTGSFYPATQPVSFTNTDYAKDATLVSILAKIIAAPSTEAKQDALNALITSLTNANHADFTSVINKLSSDPATQTTLAAVLSKLMQSIAVTGTFWQTTQPVSLASNTPDVIDRAARLLGHVTVDGSALPTGASTETTLAAVLAQLQGLNSDQGNLADLAATTSIGNFSEISIAKGALAQLIAINADQGSPSDTAATDITGSWSEIALLKAILNRLIGPSNTPNQTLVNATTTGVQALAANANRKSVIITNTTSTAVMIYYGTATTARVASLVSIGQYWQMPDYYKGIITVKSSTGTPSLEVVETTT